MIEKGVNAYRSNIRAGVRGLWGGSMNYIEFYDQMMLAIEKGFREAWEEGAAEGCIRPEDFTTSETNRLYAEINKQFAYVDGFATAIEEGSKANGGMLAPLMYRADMWINEYSRIKTLAKALALKDKKHRWTLNPAEHCGSCLKLSGQVCRMSFWLTHVMPKQWDKLDCKNACKCTLESTTDACTRGPLPGLP